MVTTPKTKQPIWIAVLVGDSAYGGFRDITDCPQALVYGRDEAFDVIRRAQADYHEKFGSLESLLDAAMLSSPTG